MILVTGGAGFIGSNFVIDWLSKNDETVINLDKLTYAGNLNNLSSIKSDERHIFVNGDISDTSLVTELLTKYQPRAIINFAAEVACRSLYQWARGFYRDKHIRGIPSFGML